MKNQKGITLIALVITIIVLLILAGITITSITGNDSTMDKAVQAKAETNKAKIRDDVSLALIASYNPALNDELLRENISKISGFSGEITKDETNNEYSFTIEGCQVKIDSQKHILIDGEPVGGNTTPNTNTDPTPDPSPVSTTEMIYDRGTFGEGWEFYTEQNYSNKKPIIHEDNYDLAGSDYRVFYTKSIDMELYSKAFFLVDNINTLSRICISEQPEQVNNEHTYYACDSNNTVITQQDDGLYLIEWDIRPIVKKGKITLSAWSNEGVRKLYKMYLEKDNRSLTQEMIYNYGTISDGYELSTTNNFCTSTVAVNEDHYQITSPNYSVLYTNEIDFSNYEFVCMEVDNINTLERIVLRQRPYNINSGNVTLTDCNTGNNTGRLKITQLENGRYLLRWNIREINSVGSITIDAYSGAGNRKVYRIWMEKE